VPDVVPREPEHRPSHRHQTVLAIAIMAEGVKRRVRLVAVDLDRQSVNRVGKIDPADQP